MRLYPFILLLIASFSCTEQQSDTIAIELYEGETSLLIFLKDKQVEIWPRMDPIKRLNHATLNSPAMDFKVGHYSFQSDSSHHYQDLISTLTKYKVSELIVFPNDPRKSGVLEPCFACPHKMAATYAKLEMLILDYPLTE